MGRLSEIVQIIDQLQSKIDSNGPLDQELQKRINYKFRLDWNYFSNAMEGNSLTRIETKQLMMDNVTIDGKSFKDISEMRGHDEQVQEIFRVGKGELRISEKRIKEMHKAIMHEDDPEKKGYIGKWKTYNNHLINYKNEKFDFLPYDEVPEAMHNLINKTNAEIDALNHQKKESKHPVLIASEFHLEYIRIHPFYDGNGRTARLLTNLLLISFGYPPFLLSEDSKKSYYRHLGEIQGYGGDPKDFHAFLGELLIESQELVLDAIAGKDISEDDDVDKEILLWKQSLKHEEVEIVEKSDVIISNIYFDSIRPLLTEFIKNHEAFRETFQSVEVHNKLGSQWWEVSSLEFLDAWAISTIDSMNSEVENISKGVDLTNYHFEGVGNINEMLVEIRFKQFKARNGLNVFDAKNLISIRLDKHSYSLTNGNTGLGVASEKLYTQKYSEKEIKDIVREKKQAFFEILKNKTSLQ